MAQLVERWLPTPENSGSNPFIGNILSTKLSMNCIIEKTYIKKKRLGIVGKPHNFVSVLFRWAARSTLKILQYLIEDFFSKDIFKDYLKAFYTRLFT